MDSMDGDQVIITEEYRRLRNGRIICTRKIGDEVLDIQDVTGFYLFIVSRPQRFEVNTLQDPEQW